MSSNFVFVEYDEEIDFTPDDYLLGQGAYSTVYRWERKNAPGGFVAAKRCDGEFARLLCHEAEMLHRMDRSPYFVKCVGLFEGTLLTTFCPGGTLADCIASRRLLNLRAKHKQAEEDALKRLATQLLSGCAFMHQIGVVHRDLKPENILLTHEDPAVADIRIGDLGFATEVPHPLPFLHDSDKVSRRGSLLYMSPERLRLDAYHVASDVWSIGLCLYELAFGKLPWDPKTEDELQANHALPIPFPDGPTTTSGAPSSPGLCALLSEMLRYDPAKRISCLECLAHPWLTPREDPPLAAATISLSPPLPLPSLGAQEQVADVPSGEPTTMPLDELEVSLVTAESDTSHMYSLCSGDDDGDDDVVVMNWATAANDVAATEGEQAETRCGVEGSDKMDSTQCGTASSTPRRHSSSSNNARPPIAATASCCSLRSGDSSSSSDDDDSLLVSAGKALELDEELEVCTSPSTCDGCSMRTNTTTTADTPSSLLPLSSAVSTAEIAGFEPTPRASRWAVSFPLAPVDVVPAGLAAGCWW